MKSGAKSARTEEQDALTALPMKKPDLFSSSILFILARKAGSCSSTYCFCSSACGWIIIYEEYDNLGSFFKTGYTSKYDGNVANINGKSTFPPKKKKKTKKTKKKQKKKQLKN